MSLIDKAKFDGANTTFVERATALFAGGGAGAWQGFTDVIASDGLTTDVVTAAVTNVLREYTYSSKQFGNLQAFKLSIPFRKFEFSLELSRETVQYDKSGAVGKAINAALTEAARNGTDKIIFDELVQASGVGPIGFDGVALLSTAHTISGSSQSNKGTAALSHDTFNTAVVAMESFVGANGLPLGIKPTTLVVGPKLQKIAKEITQSNERSIPVAATGLEAYASAVFGSTIPNVYGGGQVELVIWDKLNGTQDDYWYLMDLSRAEKPMLLARQRDFETVVMDAPNSDVMFSIDRWQASVTADMSPAAGYWPTIYGGIL